jgi:hypothetical protein
MGASFKTFIDVSCDKCPCVLGYEVSDMTSAIDNLRWRGWIVSRDYSKTMICPNCSGKRRES